MVPDFTSHLRKQLSARGNSETTRDATAARRVVAASLSGVVDELDALSLRRLKGRVRSRDGGPDWRFRLWRDDES